MWSQFGGNREVTLILSRQKEDIAGSCLRNCVLPFHGKSGVLYKRSLLIAASVSELATRRRNPESKVRGSGLEELSLVRGQWQTGGDTPRLRSGQGPGGVTSRPRPGTVTLRSHPGPEARGGSWEEPPTPEARAGSREE